MLTLRMSTRFLDGPAEGVTLQLRRAPVLLRVVQNPRGRWDALDQLDDVPEERERIHVYYRVTPVTCGHVSCRPRGFRFAAADYCVWPEQPEDVQVRENARWQAWCASIRDEVLARMSEEAKAGVE